MKLDDDTHSWLETYFERCKFCLFIGGFFIKWLIHYLINTWRIHQSGFWLNTCIIMRQKSGSEPKFMFSLLMSSKALCDVYLWSFNVSYKRGFCWFIQTQEWRIVLRQFIIWYFSSEHCVCSDCIGPQFEKYLFCPFTF